ncbi:MAG: hypothetical protein AMXMBFR82_11920 [Candidatus Hydrogenedentota bacterium]
MTREELLRYGRTLRHLKVSQILWRARYAAEKRLPILKGQATVQAPPQFDSSTMDQIRTAMGELAWILPPNADAVDALCRNEFTFLNHTEQFGHAVDWSVPGASTLWRYHLHYFGWGRTLALAYLQENREALRARFLSLADDWIDKNPRGSSPGWDAFVISSRLMNWAQAFSVFAEASPQVLESVANQTGWLLRHLEKDVRANHLLKNAQALVIAGAVLGDRYGEQATRRGLELLAQELDEQILEDGGHYERSLMYHCQVLEDNLFVHAALEDPPAKLTSVIEKMSGFLARMLYRDESIPQFGDANLDLDVPAEALLRLTKKRFPNLELERPTGCRAEVASGFYILETADGEARMTVKAGNPGPAYQLGHAHCDMLSYEFFADGRRLIVDSGVFSYDNDKWREYSRGTSAHNTVRVNGREQLECWDRFRVGRRYNSTIRAWTEHAGGQLLIASHDGFAPHEYQRIVYLAPAGFWLVADRVTGPESCDVESFVHAHPEAGVEEGYEQWRIEFGKTVVKLVPFGMDWAELVQGAESPAQGWYFPRFGEARPAPSLVLHRRNPCPVLCGYGIFYGPRDFESPERLRALAEELFAHQP